MFVEKVFHATVTENFVEEVIAKPDTAADGAEIKSEVAISS